MDQIVAASPVSSQVVPKHLEIHLEPFVQMKCGPESEQKASGPLCFPSAQTFSLPQQPSWPLVLGPPTVYRCAGSFRGTSQSCLPVSQICSKDGTVQISSREESIRKNVYAGENDRPYLRTTSLVWPLFRWHV